MTRISVDYRMVLTGILWPYPLRWFVRCPTQYRPHLPDTARWRATDLFVWTRARYVALAPRDDHDCAYRDVVWFTCWLTRVISAVRLPSFGCDARLLNRVPHSTSTRLVAVLLLLLLDHVAVTTV